jgi:hypothetical protein
LSLQKIPTVPTLNENEWVLQNKASLSGTPRPHTPEIEGPTHIDDPEFPILRPEEVSLYTSMLQIQQVDSPHAGGNSPNSPATSVMYQRQIQKHLVASVWYGKRIPHGDGNSLKLFYL